MIKKVFFTVLVLYSGIIYAQKPNEKYPSPQPLGFVMPNGYDKVTIPFEIYNNLIVIDVLLNRSLPLKFILDTGVRTAVLTEKTLTDLLNLPYSRKITIPGAGGEKFVDAFVVNNVSLNVGRIEGNGHALLVLEEDLLQLKNYLGVSVHGILGYELFSRFVVDLNYDKKIITFYDPRTYKKKRRFVEIPIVVEDTKPYLMANLAIRESDTVRGKFMLDTGASHTILLDERSGEEIYAPEPYISSSLGRGLGGNIYGKVARIDRLWVDDYRFDGAVAIFPSPDNYEISLEHNFRHGTFGGGVMSRFRIVFDFVNQKLYVRKGGSYHKPFEFNLSGLVIRADGAYLNEFEIDNIREGSAAKKAGLKEGDKIISINGVKTDKMNLDEVVGRLNDKANKKMRLVVERDNKHIHIQFKLTRLI
ncbi:MAG: aspartyl protease family protein [Bacteroidota bacterium]